jgi:hypothetical protein
MRNDPCPPGLIALTVLLVYAGSADVAAAQSRRANTINVVEATYGGNCAGVPAGNVTKYVASACDSKDLCNYRVFYKQMGGDPAEGCQKDFTVSYTCGRDRKRNACTLPAEAGKGGEDGQANHFCLLHCRAAGDASRTRSRADAGGETDGSNERERPKPRSVYRYYGGSRYGRRFDEPWW